MKQLLLIFTTVCLIWSCRKDKSPIDEHIPDLHIPEFYFGNHEGMTIKTLDTTTFEGFNWKIDMNLDGIQDIEIRSKKAGANGAGYFTFTTITCLHENFTLARNRYVDTMFVEHTWYADTVHHPGEIWVVKHIHYYCERKGTTDTVASVYKADFILPQFKQGEHIDADQEFVSSYFILNPYHNSNPGVSSSGDTVFISYKHYDDCHPYLQKDPFYYGFKITDAFGVRRGWLKFEIYGSDLHILELAIQKVVLPI